jgi:glycerophosphoryl diester phosphodiesterase
MSLLDIAMTVVDSMMAVIPRPVPERAALERCKIISHRGEHDNKRVMENTLQAFDRARSAGVWGLECDIRWTADLVPVICHDPSPARVFGVATPLNSLTFDQLHIQVPDIPRLEDVLRRFGGNTHLMLELKAEPWPEPTLQCEILRSLFAPLAPAVDYHLLALDPTLFEPLDFLPSESFFPVAETNVKTISERAIAHRYGGLGGHYLLLTNPLKRQHEKHEQRLGTGFPASKNCLFRELNRGIEWIFSNNAVALQGIRDHYLHQ